MATEKRAIYAEDLRDEIASLQVTVTGLRAGKGVLNEYMQQYRDSVLRIIDEQPTIDAAPKWISIKVDLPPKGSEDWYDIVLTRRQDGKKIVKSGYWDAYHKRFFGFDAPSNYDVTHWKPMPELPKED